ncbi:hypothetical protein [Desulfuribacillus alkaliarsenatis]|uniref:Uncharacterized protein n=1 Tax=Desulfuribacillus alkaliarsenatis TaxID=766136 RepID=A0A1E5G223_9FIRM|nr:hypothetical protein [Desulfuribacillus alkaliarsenatis]OEF96579.1 hypothetical protein BHF68_08000 [Desulfuribacillus alkaliarsenatis]
MKKKATKIVIAMAASAMLLVGTAFAAGAEPVGKNMTGEGLGQGVTKHFITDFLAIDPFEARQFRSQGLSMVEIAEQKGVSESTLIDAVVEFKTENMGETCIVEDVREKITANLTKAPAPRANANPAELSTGEHRGEPVYNQMRGQARGW